MTWKQRQYRNRQAERECSKVMLKLVKEFAQAGREMSSDNIYASLVEAEILPKVISKRVPILVRQFKANGWLKKLPKYILSKRKNNSSSILPLYSCTDKILTN